MARVIAWMMRRCRVLALAAVFSLVPNAAALAFGFDDVAAKAKSLATTAYRKPETNISKGFAGLTYDQYRDIRFDPAKAHWRNANLPFELAFFHQGMMFDTPVKI